MRGGGVAHAKIGLGQAPVEAVRIGDFERQPVRETLDDAHRSGIGAAVDHDDFDAAIGVGGE